MKAHMRARRGAGLKAALLLGLAGALAGCAEDGHLRGFVTDSPDGKTYLAIVDDHDGCPILVDGRKWTAPTGRAREIAPGEHSIECYGGEIRFVIPAGVVFNFDYWGP
ncbi:hypothetical protein QFW77_03105 [Luteimonas sp. RD2P54]|uniref:PEGA domain-containing protein n=1 Tax=Luteimonas endophytica TaxID=3042023 RepID=A0ABT6J577_9GAMM|nr:hypothetical protein [Luteimonas endophytica]MDH5821982.1 hypothetical protein [Luteimonas endophytica]